MSGSGSGLGNAFTVEGKEVKSASKLYARMCDHGTCKNVTRLTHYNILAENRSCQTTISIFDLADSQTGMNETKLSQKCSSYFVFSILISLTSPANVIRISSPANVSILLHVREAKIKLTFVKQCAKLGEKSFVGKK